LIICVCCMLYSLMANKTIYDVKNNNYNIEIEAVSLNEGHKKIEKSNYDLFLVSPQSKMNYKDLKKAGDRQSKPVINIPAQAYVPIQMGIEKLGKLILDELPEDD